MSVQSTTVTTTPALRRRGLPLAWRRRGVATAFIAPAAVLVLAVVLIPLGWNVWMSFHDISLIRPGHAPFIWFQNYTGQLTSGAFWAAVWLAFLFAIVTTMAELVLGLGLALLMNQPLRFRWLLRSVVILPWALPTIVNAMMWRWIDDAEYGPLNALLTQTGITHSYQPFLSDTHVVFWMVVLADVWKMTPLMAILLLAALQSVDHETREAASMDGAGRFQTLRHIVLPLITPIILIVLVLRTIDAFRVFDLVWIMTAGGPANATQTVAVYAYKTAFQSFDFGNSASISFLITLFLATMAFGYIRLLGRQSR